MIEFTGTVTWPEGYKGQVWQFATYRLPDGREVRLPVEVFGDKITLQRAE